MTRHVIIGAGEAGLRAAAALRDAGETDVVLLGGETVHPYERPALSKPDATAGFLRSIGVKLDGIALRLGTTATGLDRAEKTVTLSSGETLVYDRLLLATGARPRSLPGAHEATPLALRTHADAEAIYSRAHAGQHAVIIGAGLIGLEMAAELVRRQMHVTVVELGPRALGRAVPAELAEMITARHRAAGVDLRFNQTIKRIGASEVELGEGPPLRADLLVAAIGVVPEVELAQASGLACSNGILADARLGTSDPSVFAAGDCAAIDHPRYGVFRFETWRNACDQGAFAARSMLGEEQSFEILPWFWSDQYDLGLQGIGLHDPARRAVLREMPGGGLIRFELDDDNELHAAFGLGPGNSVAKDIKLAEKLIEKRARCTPEFLADPSANLKSALRGA